MGTKPISSVHPPAACRAVPAGSLPPCRTRPPGCCPGRGNRSAGVPGTHSPSVGRHTPHGTTNATCPLPTSQAAAGPAQKLLRLFPPEKSLCAARWGPMAAGSSREPGSPPATAGDFLCQPHTSRRAGPKAETPNQLHPSGTVLLAS